MTTPDTHATLPACLPPWHFQRSEDGSLTWFRPLSLFANSKIHYRVGSVPSNEHTRRIYDFGNGSPWTCDSCGNVIHCPRSDEKPPPPPPAFDGYPYLVTRIGQSALRSVVILPAEWTRGHLIDLARRQATANRLDTCLCIGPDHAIYVTPDGKTSRRDVVPTGIPVGDRLALSEPIPDTPDVLARRASLEDFRKALAPSGYLVGDGLEGGRRATGADFSEVTVRRGVPITTTTWPDPLHDVPRFGRGVSGHERGRERRLHAARDPDSLPMRQRQPMCSVRHDPGGISPQLVLLRRSPGQADVRGCVRGVQPRVPGPRSIP